jgi:hypothetical protein
MLLCMCKDLLPSTAMLSAAGVLLRRSSDLCEHYRTAHLAIIYIRVIHPRI